MKYNKYLYAVNKILRNALDLIHHLSHIKVNKTQMRFDYKKL